MSDGDEIRGIFIIILIIQSIFFSIKYALGIFLVLGLFFYFRFFTYKDKKIKKKELNDILRPREHRIMHDRIIPKEFP